MFKILFYQPEIPPNTGNAIRLAANTGCELHLIEPLGFTFADAQLRRAGLNYHDVAVVHRHENLQAAWDALLPANVYAFSARADKSYHEISYQPGDVLLFGPESSGLPDEVQQAPEIRERLRIPIITSTRSLNLSNATSIAVYEAWRQHSFHPVHSGQS